jgi:hypothetical protein
LCAIYDHIDNLGRDICESKYLSKDDKISSANETILNDFGVLGLARAHFLPIMQNRGENTNSSYAVCEKNERNSFEILKYMNTSLINQSKSMIFT